MFLNMNVLRNSKKREEGEKIKKKGRIKEAKQRVRPQPISNSFPLEGSSRMIKSLSTDLHKDIPILKDKS